MAQRPTLTLEEELALARDAADTRGTVLIAVLRRNRQLEAELAQLRADTATLRHDPNGGT